MQISTLPELTTSSPTSKPAAPGNGTSADARPDRVPPSRKPAPRPRRRWRSALLLLAVAGAAAGLGSWKAGALQAQAELAASQPEPVEAVTVAAVEPREHQGTTSAIGTVLALRSITLRNELPGTVAEVRLEPGALAEAGELLVALDVSVEEAELAAQEARAALAETLLGRLERAMSNRGASEADVDRARAERDVALAEVARTRAVIERKTLRAPFRARVGISDIHRGQYLNEGTAITTLQSVDEAVHVDFSVPQHVAAGLRAGEPVSILEAPGAPPFEAAIVAVDARVDPATRNAMVRARIEVSRHDGGHGLPGRVPAPGSSVRVRVPIGDPQRTVVVPASALRKGPAGDHVFVLEPDEEGALRAHQKMVTSGPALGDDVVIEAGLAAGESVAASGSFKLYEGVLVAVAPAPEEEPRPETAAGVAR